MPIYRRGSQAGTVILACEEAFKPIINLISLKRLDMNIAVQAARRFEEWAAKKVDDEALVIFLQEGITVEEARERREARQLNNYIGGDLASIDNLFPGPSSSSE